MSSSPRFWQKLGLGKHHKTTSNSDKASIHSVQQQEEDNNGRQLKRFSSTLTLRHKSSSISLYQQSTNTGENQLRRASYMKPLRRVDPVETTAKPNENSAVTDAITPLGGRTSPNPTNILRPPLTKLPLSRKQSCIELGNYNTTKLPSRLLKRTKSNQSLSNNSNTKLRQQRPTSPLVRNNSNSSLHQHLTKKKSFPQIVDTSDDDSKICLTRSSSNGSSSTTRRHPNVQRNKSVATQTTDSNEFDITMLKDELEREKSSARALFGQKEAIAKDLDYFCKMFDEVSDEKDDYKRKYEEEVNRNEDFKRKIKELQSRLSVLEKNENRKETQSSPPAGFDSSTKGHENMQLKNDEIIKLKGDLKQSQRQIQILRKTMEQLLKVDGRDYLEDTLDGDTTKSDPLECGPDSKKLLLLAGYQPEEVLTNPPSPLPFNPLIDEDDLMSTTSKESTHSYRSKAYSVNYDFLKNEALDDDHPHYLSKKRSEDFSKKLALTRIRKNQLEEMLGEVDSQLNRVKQKMRPTS